MQVVARVEKAAPPTRTAVLAASARAVLAVVTDPLADDPQGWQPALARWADEGRIRKHARRARGAAWERLDALPGRTVEVDGAQVRAFVPTPVGALPRALAGLQLSGRELDDPDRLETADPPAGHLVVTITPAPFLPLGKAAAAAGHAAQLAWVHAGPGRRDRWRDAGFPLVVVQPGAAGWPPAVRGADVVVRDAGHTVVTPGTVTAAARWVPD